MEKRATRNEFDISQLLHPGSAFDHPRDVVADPDLTLTEKRAILAAWASDACALEATPSLREIRKGRVVAFDDIMDALRALEATGRVVCPATIERHAGVERPVADIRRREVARPCSEASERLQRDGHKPSNWPILVQPGRCRARRGFEVLASLGSDNRARL